MGFVLDFHMCLNVGDIHMSEHNTAVGMGPKCVWKFDVKYPHKVEDWLKIKAYCIIKCISDRVEGQRRGFVCLSVCQIFWFAIVLLNNQVESSTNPYFFSALLAIITEGHTTSMF